MHIICGARGHSTEDLQRDPAADRVMVLIDTSGWIAHLRQSEHSVVNLLCDGQVLTHPFVVEELACGNLRERAAILADFDSLAAAICASDAEVMHLIEERRLWGRGLVWIDAHLIASAIVSHCRLWTLDKRLEAAVAYVGLE